MDVYFPGKDLTSMCLNNGVVQSVHNDTRSHPDHDELGSRLTGSRFGQSAARTSP